LRRPRGRRGVLLQSGHQLVQAQLLQALPHRLELAGAQLDQLAALAHEVQGFAQARLAGVQAADYLLDAGAGLLVGGRGGGSVLGGAHDPFSILASTAASAKEIRTRAARRASSARVTSSPLAS